jgi:S1-C subfamily serine protease
MYKLALLFCLLFASISYGDGFNIELAEDMSVVVANVNGAGSGVPIEIDGFYYIITANHVTYEILPPPIPILPPLRTEYDTPTIINGDRVADGVVVMRNLEDDIAIIQIDQPISDSMVELSRTRPAKCSRVHCLGNMRQTEDSYSTGYVSHQYSRNPGFIGYLQLDCQIVAGSSGGPVFGDDMKCYGIASAIDEMGGISYFVASDVILDWIRTLPLD